MLASTRVLAEEETVPPDESWYISDYLLCDFNTRRFFQSPSPGDSVEDVLNQYIAALNAQCAGAYGSVSTYSLNPCTPNITISSNGQGNPNASGSASGCTVRVQTINQPPFDRNLPSATKICVAPGETSNNGYGTGAQFTLTSAPAYGECKCPKGTSLFNGTCVPTQDRAAKPPDLCAGNPIRPGTGNKLQNDVDYAGTGSFPLTMSRVYNSASYLERWQSSFDRSIRYYSPPPPLTTIATLVRPEGRFSFIGGTSDRDVLYKLSGANTRYVVTTPDGLTTENYNGSNLIQNVNLLNGPTIYAFTYSTSSTPPGIASQPNLLIGVSDPFGHSLSFTYDTAGRRKSMTDPGGGTYQYAYGPDGNLTSVIYPDGTSRQYLYNEAPQTGGANLPGALTGIIDESGVRFASYAYNAAGLAISSEHAGGVERFSVTYDQQPPTVYLEPVYDSSGNIQRVIRYVQPSTSVTLTDPLGQSRPFGFLLTSVGSIKTTGTSAPVSGACTETPLAQSFDSNGNVALKTDFNNNTTTYVYDLSRNVETSRTEAAGTAQERTITTTWNSSFRLPDEINEPGKRTTYTYNSIGNVLTKTILDTASNQSRRWAYTYNNYGQVLTVDGPRTDLSDVTTYTYYNCNTGNECGQVETVRDALGHITTYNTYNAHGQPLTITDPNGVVTTLTYDLRQRLTSRSVAGEQTTFEYFPTGLLKKITLPDSSAIQYFYDPAHRLTQITDTDGSYIVYTLDAIGNRTEDSVYDPQGVQVRTHTRTFNSLSRLASDINAGGAVATTTYEYDSNGNQIAVNAPLQRTTLAAFDALDRLKQTTDEMNGVTQYGYNALDQLTTVTDPRNLQTTYTYNALDDLKQQSSPDSGVTQFTYDPAGNVATRTDARGKVGTYSYDATNRLTQVQYADQTQTFNYDQGTNGIGRLTSLSDSSGSTSYTYTSLGRVASKTQVMGSVTKVVGYGYNAAGQLASITTPSGQAVTYGYTDGRITSIAVNGTDVLNQVLYEPLGPTRGWTWGNGTLTVREFDTDGRLHSIDSAGLTTYAFNPDDTILSKMSDDSAASPASSATTLSIATDSNRLSATSGALNRTYTYDLAGNVTGNGTSSFAYNDAGRMVSSTTVGVTTTYALNALGQRVKKSNVSGTTYFVYDENGRLHGEYDGSGALIQELVWLDDIPVATIRTTSGGSGVGVFYIHTDHLNGAIKITRPADNASIWRWDHDPFGVGAPSEDPDGNGLALVFNLRFPGQYFDSETGLHYNYFRDYDPATGRYVESDPIGLEGGINTYAYVGGNPVSAIDENGLDKVDLFGNKKEDQIFHKRVREYKDDPSKCLVYAHGRPDAVIDGRTGKPLRGADLAKVLIDAGCRPDQPVEIYACRTGDDSNGKDPVAKSITNYFPSVTAPDKTIFYNPAPNSNGPTYIYGKDPAKPKTPNFNDPGRMRTFR